MRFSHIGRTKMCLRSCSTFKFVECGSFCARPGFCAMSIHAAKKRGAKAEISAIFDRMGLKPNAKFTAYGGCAVISMVENRLGLPELILSWISRKIVT